MEARFVRAATQLDLRVNPNLRVCEIAEKTFPDPRIDVHTNSVLAKWHSVFARSFWFLLLQDREQGIATCTSTKPKCTSCRNVDKVDLRVHLMPVTLFGSISIAIQKMCVQTSQ